MTKQRIKKATQNAWEKVIARINLNTIIIAALAAWSGYSKMSADSSHQETMYGVNHAQIQNDKLKADSKLFRDSLMNEIKEMRNELKDKK